MTSMLPPTRDLPPGRHTQIRAELERTVNGRRSRRLVVPILAGVAAVVAVVTSVVVLQPDPKPTPAVQITTSPAPAIDFGIPPEEVAAIEEGCAGSAGTGRRAKLRQLLNDQTRWAVLYSEKEGLVCNIGVGGVAYNAAFGQTEVQWLPGHFSIDHQGARSGGDMDGRPASVGVPGDRTSVGRVDDEVARVTYTVNGQTVDATVANGTYAARIYYPSSWSIPNIPANETVRAYDAAGNLLGTSSDLQDTCYYEPYNMRVVYGNRREEASNCKPVSPWR